MEKIKLDWTNLSTDPKWYDYFTEEVVPEPAEDAEGAFVKVRPYPSHLAKVVLTQDGLLLSGEQQKAIYDHSFLDFRGTGIVGADDQPIKFSPEVKEKIWTYKMAGIPDLVIRKSREYEKEKKAQEKN